MSIIIFRNMVGEDVFLSNAKILVMCLISLRDALHHKRHLVIGFLFRQMDVTLYLLVPAMLLSSFIHNKAIQVSLRREIRGPIHT